MDKVILNSKQIEKMSSIEKEKYYSSVREYCLSNKGTYKKRKKSVQKVIGKVAPIIRRYDFEVIGQQNIPNDEKVLFVANHSNAHDFFTMQEAFKTVGIEQTFLASNEDLSPLILSIFSACGGVLFDRKDKISAEQAFIDFTSNILHGMPGVIYAESTWNLHPFKPMHLIKAGAANIAAIAGVKIVPVIYEYVEVPVRCNKESKIFSKCIVKFCNPIGISRTDNMYKQTETIQRALEQNRLELWETIGIMKKSVSDIDQDIYLNHTYLKKFGGAGEYDTLREMQYLLVKDQLSGENEYHRDKNENFLPGILTKEEGKRYI